MTRDEAANLHGRCRCGAYRFRAHAEPFQVSYCHCSDCRKATGAPVTVFVGFRESEVDLLGEAASAYLSSSRVQRLYCGKCGTPIGYSDARLPGEIYYYLGVLEAQDGLVPQLHAFVSEKLPWLEIEDGLPRHERFSRSRSG